MKLNTIRLRLVLPFLSLLPVLILASLPAKACSFPHIETSPEKIKHAAQVAFSQSDSVIDAEVLSPMVLGSALKDGLTPMAELRVLNSWKGLHKKDDVVFVIFLSSCDIALQTKGEKIRILLNGSHEMYRAEQSFNGYGNARRPYNVEIDRLIRRVRPAYISADPGM
jgi:hypothetical protein